MSISVVKNPNASNAIPIFLCTVSSHIYPAHRYPMQGATYQPHVLDEAVNTGGFHWIRSGSRYLFFLVLDFSL